MIDELKLLKGSPIYVDNIAVYPLTIGEITDLGLDKYNLYLNLININKDKFEIDDEEISNFDTICQFCLHNIDIGVEKKFKELYFDALKTFLRNDINFVVDDDCTYFIVGDISEHCIISNINYEQIVEIIKHQNCLIKINEEDECNPADEKARQLLERRKKVRELLAKAKNQNDDDPLTLADLVSILIANGNGVTPFNVWDMNFYMFNNQFNRMRMLEEYDINIRSLLAGAKSEDINMKHWMSKI
jgi:hypothetical protein